MTRSIDVYILIMALTTYAIRALPLVALRKEIKNPFVRSFLYYVPYAALAAMTFPAILYSTASMLSGLLGFAAALILAYREKSLLTVALFSCGVVFLTERILALI